MSLLHRIIAWFRPAPDDLTETLARGLLNAHHAQLPDRFRSVDGDMEGLK